MKLEDREDRGDHLASQLPLGVPSALTPKRPGPKVKVQRIPSGRTASPISHLPSSVFHLPSPISHLPSPIFHLPSSIFRLPSSIFHLPSSIFHLPSSVCHLPSSVLLFLGATSAGSTPSAARAPRRSRRLAGRCSSSTSGGRTARATVRCKGREVAHSARSPVLVACRWGWMTWGGMGARARLEPCSARPPCPPHSKK